MTGKQSPNILAYKIMRKARDGLKVEYTGVNLARLEQEVLHLLESVRLQFKEIFSCPVTRNLLLLLTT